MALRMSMEEERQRQESQFKANPFGKTVATISETIIDEDDEELLKSLQMSMEKYS